MIPSFRLLAVLSLTLGAAAGADNPYLGRWALTIPGGGAGWLGVEEKNGGLESSILWGGGSVVPTRTTTLGADGKLTVTRVSTSKTKGSQGREVTETTTETITATVAGDELKLETVKSKDGGPEFGRAAFAGKRIPPVPAKPDLGKVKFGEPIRLFNGRDLTGWKLLNPGADNGWSVRDGVLMNRVAKGGHFGNLRTDAEFGDFNLKLGVRTQEGSNSGIYLRGIYEVQIAESFGKPLDPHHMGALYSRIRPAVAAEKPIGEWQTLDITLVARHLTVILNGKTIIDNQPVLGCTGGAITSDESKPGPIYLQGDHTNIDYRDLVLRKALP